MLDFKMKKIIACFLCSIMIFSMPFNVSALSKSLNDTIELIEIEPGVWEEVNTSNYARTSNTMAVQLCENEEFLYENQNGNYYQKVDLNTYLSVEKINLPLTSYSTYETLKNYGYPKEVTDAIASLAYAEKESGNTDAKVVIYVPNSTRSSSVYPSGEIKTYWNNKTFSNYIMNVTNLTTGPTNLATGSSVTESLLKTLVNIGFYIAGNSEGALADRINLISNALSLWDSWKDTNPNGSVYIDSGNKAYFSLDYDVYYKYTYYNDTSTGFKRLGCSSQKYLFKKASTNTIINAPTGQLVDPKYYQPNKLCYTPNYISPEETAYYHQYSGWVETLKAEVGSTTVHFATYPFNWPSDWPTYG